MKRGWPVGCDINPMSMISSVPWKDYITQWNMSYKCNTLYIVIILYKCKLILSNVSWTLHIHTAYCSIFILSSVEPNSSNTDTREPPRPSRHGSEARRARTHRSGAHLGALSPRASGGPREKGSIVGWRAVSRGISHVHTRVNPMVNRIIGMLDWCSPWIDGIIQNQRCKRLWIGNE